MTDCEPRVFWLFTLYVRQSLRVQLKIQSALGLNESADFVFLIYEWILNWMSIINTLTLRLRHCLEVSCLTFVEFFRALNGRLSVILLNLSWRLKIVPSQLVRLRLFRVNLCIHSSLKTNLRQRDVTWPTQKICHCFKHRIFAQQQQQDCRLLKI